MTTRTLTPTLPVLGALARRVEAVRQGNPERAERRRVAREFAAYPASRGVALTVLPSRTGTR
ncbi:hypothetical protein [Ornithinicoccus hortensis]|uniref:Uncharacterized protein n=1 Tax=Ornithinicoccus hortensis TaxID=82346 RepID=A0A542YLP9_9MICO|nr:hypothetical protein [Ornithinicoccus hortensis]TQL49015.1 hypothetical protein FB467_0079 [Ornithinicoccus hortensis]